MHASQLSTETPLPRVFREVEFCGAIMGGKVYEWHSYQIGPEEQLGLTRLQINFSPTEMVETSDEQIFLRGIRYLRKHHQESYVVDEVKASPTEN